MNRARPAERTAELASQRLQLWQVSEIGRQRCELAIVVQCQRRHGLQRKQLNTNTEHRARNRTARAEMPLGSVVMFVSCALSVTIADIEVSAGQQGES